MMHSESIYVLRASMGRNGGINPHRHMIDFTFPCAQATALSLERGRAIFHPKTAVRDSGNRKIEEARTS